LQRSALGSRKLYGSERGKTRWDVEKLCDKRWEVQDAVEEELFAIEYEV
jgi:hypothetical protein